MTSKMQQYKYLVERRKRTSVSAEIFSYPLSSMVGSSQSLTKSSQTFKQICLKQICLKFAVLRHPCNPTNQNFCSSCRHHPHFQLQQLLVRWLIFGGCYCRSQSSLEADRRPQCEQRLLPCSQQKTPGEKEKKDKATLISVFPDIYIHRVVSFYAYPSLSVTSLAMQLDSCTCSTWQLQKQGYQLWLVHGMK